MDTSSAVKMALMKVSWVYTKSCWPVTVTINCLFDYCSCPSCRALIVGVEYAHCDCIWFKVQRQDTKVTA